MTINSAPQIDEERGYIERSLNALRQADSSFFGRRSLYHEKFTNPTCADLFTIFEEIRQDTSSLSPSQAHFGLVMGYEAPCKYRRPVWEAVDEVLKTCIESARFRKPQERAEWFQGVLRLCDTYEAVQELVKNFEAEVKKTAEAKKIDLRVGVDSWGSAISVVLDRHRTGANARALAQRLVPEMLKAVEDLCQFH